MHNAITQTLKSLPKTRRPSQREAAERDNRQSHRQSELALAPTFPNVSEGPAGAPGPGPWTPLVSSSKHAADRSGDGDPSRANVAGATRQLLRAAAAACRRRDPLCRRPPCGAWRRGFLSRPGCPEARAERSQSQSPPRRVATTTPRCAREIGGGSEPTTQTLLSSLSHQKKFYYFKVSNKIYL